jgi:hypothetical protein
MFPRVGSMPLAILLFHTSESHPCREAGEEPNAESGALAQTRMDV